MKIEFQQAGKATKVVEIDPDNRPTSDTGERGSILDMALAMDIEIYHACGGVCACSTCHVIVREGLSSCGEITEEEEDQLDEAQGTELRSRLACQCIPSGNADLVVAIPARRF